MMPDHHTKKRDNVLDPERMIQIMNNLSPNWGHLPLRAKIAAYVSVMMIITALGVVAEKV
jgi:hypothetical protein